MVNSDLAGVSFLVSIVDSISACHAEDRGSIPRRGVSFLLSVVVLFSNGYFFCNGKKDRY